MERIKKQFGTTIIDGTEKKYCQVSILLDNNDVISEISLTEHFKLIAKSFWIYLKDQSEHENNINMFEASTELDFDDAELKKGWLGI